MKSDNLITLLVVGGVAYYLFKTGAFNALGSSSAPSVPAGTIPGSNTAQATTAASSASSVQTQVFSPITSQPGLAIQITSNPNTVVPGSSTAYNKYLAPDQQVNPNDPPPIHCQAGQWPTRDARFAGGWICASPRLMI